MLRIVRRLVVVLGAIAGLLILVGVAYVLKIAIATHTGVAASSGTRMGLTLDAPVTIARDARGVPHIRAATDHDLFFAEGYAMASDRLFQMDLTRRYTLGRLAEMLGAPLLGVDRRMRSYDIAHLAERAYAGAPATQRVALQAFADGINAAATTQPQPPEYTALWFPFERWRPQDAIAVGYATLIDLDDNASEIVARDAVRRILGPVGTNAFFPLTDPKYDVPTDGSAPGAIAALPALTSANAVASIPYGEERPPIGSNGWAIGSARSANGHAMLANDPHLSLGIPTIWWLVEARSPHYHIAGAALAGTPGVTLGHNDHVAWGVTAGETSAMRLVRLRTRGTDEFDEGGGWVHARHRIEQIRVRFGNTVAADDLDLPQGTVIERGAAFAYVRDWRPGRIPTSSFSVFLAIDAARSAGEALADFRNAPEPALNLLVADDRGRAGYHLTGAIPLDAAWGRYALGASAPEPALLRYDAAAHVDPSRRALIVTSNNRSSAHGPRLAPFWPAPYRAYEIHQVLDASRAPNGTWTAAAFGRAQFDDRSPAELEFARLILASAHRTHADADPTLTPIVGALRTFDGTISPDSRGASAVRELRADIMNALAAAHLPPEVAAATGSFEVALRALRERPRGWVPHDDYDGFITISLRRVQARFGPTIPTFGTYGAMTLAHPLAAFGLRAWNGATLFGHGGSFAPAVQWRGHGQSFRALWIAGDWDASSIDIDAGESGEPGSRHYADQTAKWQARERTTLPFSDDAVRAATISTLTLEPTTAR